MKKLMFAIATLLVFASPAFAESNESFCRHVSIYAEKAMYSRQQGIALSNLIKAANGNSLFGAIIVNAYEYPKYEDRSNIGTIICEFRDMWYVICIKQLEE